MQEKLEKTSLWAVWAEQHFLPQTSQEGNECTATLKELRAYCSNICTLTEGEK